MRFTLIFLMSLLSYLSALLLNSYFQSKVQMIDQPNYIGKASRDNKLVHVSHNQSENQRKRYKSNCKMNKYSYGC